MKKKVEKTLTTAAVGWRHLASSRFFYVFSKTRGKSLVEKKEENKHRFASTHLNGKEKFEFWGKLFLRIQAIREVDAPDAAVRMYLHAQRFNVVSACTT
jgi:hypothetical protein